MLFNSLAFLGSFAVFYPCYLLLHHRHRAQNTLLLIASYIFYGAWDYRFLALIGFSTLLDFEVGKRLSRLQGPARRYLLWLSIVINLGLLGVFKYFNFFADSLSLLLSTPLSLATVHIVLPVGISFYTFQSMSYTIDVYRGDLEPTKNLWDFALYIAFFPQLVAGPIERAGRLLDRIRGPRQVTAEDVEIGLFLLSWGFYLKVVVADNLARIANAVFSKPEAYYGWDIWLGVICFAVQIYADFSGYSSIARGLARLLGFELSLNFNHPYFALTPSEFWQRWHITLSQWLRDYLYIPLGGNRGGRLYLYRNLMLTMILGGLWHGAAWNFLLWGAYHGLILCIYKALSIEPSEHRLIRVAQWLVMTVLTLLGWVLFRAGSVQDIGLLLSHVGFTSSGATRGYLADLLFFAGPMFAFEAWQHFRQDLLVVCRSGVAFSVAFHFLTVSLILVFGVRAVTQFLYFQF